MYKILYIDDEKEHIEDFIEDNETKFYVETVDLVNDATEMTEIIVDKITKDSVDCVILDHFLKQTRPMLNYNGGTVACNILDRFIDYPVFLLTAKEEDAFSYSLDPLHIISKEKYNEGGGRDYYIKRVSLFIHQYKKKIYDAESRLKELSDKEELDANEEIEEIELNEFLEKTVIGEKELPIKKFTRRETSKLDKLLELAESILDGK